MDSFIRKIFEGRSDYSVHVQLQKYSRGEFKDKALVNISKIKDKFNISTTYEYASDFVQMFGELIPQGKKVKVSGIIVSTRNLKEIEEFSRLFSDVAIKQFMGVKQYIINHELSKENINSICKLLPNSFLGLSFIVGENELKIKSKAPKSAKPSTSDKGPSVDFCKIKTNNLEILKSVFFEGGEFKKVSINHVISINDIKIPKEEKDPAKMRENAIRKGKLIRKINIDGKELVKEAIFEA